MPEHERQFYLWKYCWIIYFWNMSSRKYINSTICIWIIVETNIKNKTTGCVLLGERVSQLKGWWMVCSCLRVLSMSSMKGDHQDLSYCQYFIQNKPELNTHTENLPSWTPFCDDILGAFKHHTIHPLSFT